MSDVARAPTRFPWPPVLYIAAIVVAIVLSILVPLPWFGSPFADLLLAVGCLLVLAFLALTITAMRTLSRARTTVMPTAPRHIWSPAVRSASPAIPSTWPTRF